jgi:uncharacterized caspase-like protein
MRFALAVLALLTLAGCSTVDLPELNRGTDLAQLREALKGHAAGHKLYVAPVVVDCKEDEFAESASDHYGMHLERDRLAAEIGQALGAMFDAVKVHEDAKEGTSEAARAAFVQGYDLLLVPHVKKFDTVFVKTNGWWWPNALFIAWYFYFPVWWIADEVYGVQTTVEYDIVSVRNERPLPGLSGREVVVDSKVAEDVSGVETPRGPRVDMDDLDRGIDLLGTYHPGSLDRDQWEKRVQVIMEPYGRRATALAVAQDISNQFAKFTRRDAKEQSAATAAIHAVAVGVGQYGPNDACAYADKDAIAFTAWLTGQASAEAAPIGTGTLVNRTSVKLVRTLVNGRASRADVLAELARVAESTRPEDTFIFYFAGRATRTTNASGLAGLGLACYGAAKQDEPGSPNVLTLEELRQVMARAKAETKTVILDASFGGGLRGMETPKGGLTAAVLESTLSALAGGDGAVIVASGPDEPAYVLEAAKHGLFTYALIDGLRGAADVDKGGVTWEALAKHLGRSVTTLSQLDQEKPQHPIVYARVPRTVVFEH